MGGWHFGPRRYGYGGGGCCGSIAAIPILLVFIIFMIIYMIGGIFSRPNNVQLDYETSGIYYDEMALQDFADEQYAKEFGDSAAYEDNLLIVFLTEEDCYNFYYIAWVGDHIATDINVLMGDNDTALGEAMLESINETNYKYSLDANLAVVINSMEKQILELGLESSYTCEEDHSQVESHLTNYTELPMTESTVNDALAQFTQSTGIPVVIVVEDMEEVFGTSSLTTDVVGSDSTAATGTRSFSVISVLLIAALVILVVVLLVSRNRKKKEGSNADDERTKQYRQFDDQY